MRWLLWLILAMPFIELWFIIRVGTVIGALPTLFLLLATGMLGMNLLRLQGFHTLTRLDQRLQSGELPATEILEGFALSLAAALLVFPGFISDALAIPLLIPPVRRWLIKRFLGTGFYVQHYSARYQTPFDSPFSRKGDIIEGDVIDVEPSIVDNKNPHKDEPRLR